MEGLLCYPDAQFDLYHIFCRLLLFYSVKFLYLPDPNVSNSKLIALAVSFADVHASFPLIVNGYVFFSLVLTIFSRRYWCFPSEYAISTGWSDQLMLLRLWMPIIHHIEFSLSSRVVSLYRLNEYRYHHENISHT